MRTNNINANIVRVFENLYDKAQSAVLFSASTGSELQLGSVKGVYSQPRIMCEALDDHEGCVNIGRRFNTNFRFADDIVVNAEEDEEADVDHYKNSELIGQFRESDLYDLQDCMMT